MKIRNVLLITLAMVLFSACASMYVPDSDLINKLQIVKMGNEKPEGHEYILHIPAGTKIPVNFSVNGSLISAPIENKSVTKINQELYIYKYWASFDGKNWQPTRDVIKMPITLDVNSEGGQIHVKVDLLTR